MPDDLGVFQGKEAVISKQGDWGGDSSQSPDQRPNFINQCFLICGGYSVCRHSGPIALLFERNESSSRLEREGGREIFQEVKVLETQA